MNQAFTFDDILIIPQFSEISSRKDVDLSFNGSNYPYMSLPIISANMDTVTDANMAKHMILNGAQACLHRFCTIDESVKMFQDSYMSATGESPRTPMVSIGLGKDELDRAAALFGTGAYQFVIDVAHGAQQSVVDQVLALREIIKNNAAIIVGNFASGDSVLDFLWRSGHVDGIKVGIGPGAACTTRIKTGIGFPQLSAVLEISQVLHYNYNDIPVIADGGMKNSGDIAKALAAGASMVMLGSMLAGTEESPGQMYYVDGLGKYVTPEEFLSKDAHVDGSITYVRNEYSESFTKVKKYRGSASKESYVVQGKDASWRTAEGESFFVPYKGSVKNILQDIEGGLRSAFTYVGAKNLKEFHSKAKFVQISNAGYSESLPHGKK